MTHIPGLDTIMGLVGEPPPEIKVPYKLVKTENSCQQGWNACHIAIIPYCYKCKAVLVWHRPPHEKGHEDELFTCPSCGRVWVRGEGWK